MNNSFKIKYGTQKIKYHLTSLRLWLSYQCHHRLSKIDGILNQIEDKIKRLSFLTLFTSYVVSFALVFLNPYFSEISFLFKISFCCSILPLTLILAFAFSLKLSGFVFVHIPCFFFSLDGEKTQQLKKQQLELFYWLQKEHISLQLKTPPKIARVHKL